MKTIRNRKSFYSPGMLSLIVLPLLCLVYFYKRNAFTNYNSMDHWLWNGKIGVESNQLLEPKYNVDSILRNRNFKIVNLNGINDDEKLVNASNMVKEIIQTKDTLNGIKFHFGKKCKYDTFVKTLDILTIQKARYYVPFEDDIWFLYLNFKTKNLREIPIISM